MIEFDHTKMADRDPAEMKRFRDWIDALKNRGAENMAPEERDATILHEDDKSCCLKEEWTVTMKAAIAEPAGT